MDDDIFFCLAGTVLAFVVPFGFLGMFLFETRSRLSQTRREVRELEEAVGLLRLALQHARAPADAAPTTAPATAPAPSPVRSADEVTLDLPLPEAPVVAAPADLPPADGAPPRPAPAAAPEPPEAAAPEAPAADDGPPARPPRPAVAPAFRLPELSPERLVVWIAAGLGGLAALLAALFGLVTLVERGWLGPAARVSLALVGGTAMWVGGAWAGRRWPRAGSALAGAGIGTLYGAAYAGSALYHLFSAGTASAAMIGVTVVGTVRAWRRDDRFVAWLSLLGGLLTPVLVSTGTNRPYALFGYLALLATGMVVAAVRRGWPEVVLGAALGAAALHAGWTSQWYAADQVPAALTGALLLFAPFAAVAATRTGLVRWAGLLGAGVLVVASLAWLVPVDPHFVDPRTGIEIARAAGFAQPLVVGAALLFTLPMVAGARRFEALHDLLPAAVPAVVLPVVAASAWAPTDASQPGWQLALAAGPGALALAASVGRPLLARVTAVAALVGGTLALSASQPGLEGPWLAGPLLLLVGLTSASWGATRWGLVLAAGLAGVAVVEGAALAAFEPEELRLLLGPALLALALFGQGGVRLPSRDDVRAGWLAAAAAPIVVFPLMYRVWVADLGDAVIGALPLALAAATLVGALALIRRQRLDRADLMVAVFTLVVLLGVTAAVPLQLRERWLTVAWALEAALLARLGRDLLRHPLIRGASLVLSAFVAVRLLANPWALSWGRAEGWALLNWTLYTWGVPALCLAYVAKELPDEPGDPWRLFKLPVGILALLVGFGLVNVEVSHAFQRGGPLALDLFGGDRLQSMVRSASWAGYGLLVLGGGLWRDSRAVRLLGFCFVLLATFKVFLVDLWDLSGFLRVGSLAALAFALILAAFAFERLVLRGAGRSHRKSVEET